MFSKNGFLTIVLIASSLSLRTFASPSFPGVVQVETSAVVACTLCHTDPGGGGGNVKQPVGVALVSRGLFAGDDAGLVLALTQLEEDNTDSDGDGVSDVAELRAGLDPNVAGGTEPAVNPQYGFGCSSTNLIELQSFIALCGFVLTRRNNKNKKI
jgi:hypothetical protein